MIPVSLYLKNFLSYGDNVPPLDFTEFDIACLSGSNGHGKSAVLDAMTWAIWGEARKAVGEKSPSDGLLRIGTTEMQVELVFDLAGDRYRVLRKYQKKRQKRGSISLEFQVFDETSNSYKSLSERTIRTTQDIINSTLRMNYETFINSAFILQGRVDEFTQKSPGRRKEILAEILDLSRYERLRELAKDHYRKAEGEWEIFKAQLQSIDEELQHKGEYERQLHDLQQQLTELDNVLAQHNKKLQALEKQRTELQGKQQQLEDKKRQQKQSCTECQRLDDKIKSQECQIAEVDAILQQEKGILATYRQYEELKAKNTEYEEKFRQTSQYESQKRTLEQAIQKERHELEKRLGKRQTELSQVQKMLNEAQKLLKKEQEIEKGFRELQTCREQIEILDEKQTGVTTIDHSIKELEKEIFHKKSQLEIQLHASQQEAASLQTLADKQADREQHLRQCQEAVTQLESLEKELEKSKEEGTECRTRLENLKLQEKQLQQTKQDVQEKVDLLKRSDQPQCPLCGSELDTHKKSEIDDHFREELRHIEEEKQQITRKIREHDALLEDLRKQYKRIESQRKKLQNAQKDYAQAEHALQESQKARERLKDLNTQTDTLRMQIQNRQFAPDEHKKLTTLQKEKEGIGYDQKEHQSLKATIKSLRRFEGEYSKLEDTRERHRKAADSVPEIQQEIDRITSDLKQRNYARPEHAQVEDVLTSIQKIGYDEQAHKQAKQDLEGIQDAPVRKEQLERARKDIKTLQQELAEAVTERQQKTLHRVDLHKQIVELEQDLETLPAIEQDVKEANRALQECQKKRDNVLQQRGTYQNKYEHCQQLEKEFAQKQEQAKHAEKDSSMYEQLMKIFGRDGIQAYLIDNAIPEIEEEANGILSRLTDNRTSISIESVKDLQRGGTKETLDIKISDELGTRSYEMYSGGEAFRVDFAIRIALSKLLATRAGTQLKTLVIDEGFGTQDARGLEQLVEAIKTISLDFEKILVITHLEALKDAFPVRIEVVKHPDIGSQYQIVH